MKKYIFLFLLVATFASCEKDQLSSNDKFSEPFRSSHKKQSKDIEVELSGEEYFKAIFFLDSDLIDKVTPMKEYKENYIAELRKSPNFDEEFKQLREIQDSFLIKIHELDNTFFTYYKDAMESGNPLTVRTALIRAGDIFRKALYSDEELLEYFIYSEEIIKNIDIEKFTNKEGEVDIERLNKEIESYINKDNKYRNSENTMKSFGASGSGNHALCAAIVFFYGVTVIATISYVAALNIAAVVNAGLVINAAAVAVLTYAVKIDVTYERDGGSGGGGGGTCTPSPNNKGNYLGTNNVENQTHAFFIN